MSVVKQVLEYAPDALDRDWQSTHWQVHDTPENLENDIKSWSSTEL